MSDRKLSKEAKKLFKSNGELPLVWECGFGDVDVGFSGWGIDAEDPDDPNHKLLEDVRWVIIEKAGLGGGDDGSRNKAIGKICTDSMSGGLVLEMTQIVNSDGRGSKQKQELPNLNLPDVFIWCEIYLKSGKIGEYRIDPVVDDEKRENFFEEMVKLGREQAEQYTEKFSDVETVYRVAFQGDWCSETKTFNFATFFYFGDVVRQIKISLE